MKRLLMMSCMFTAYSIAESWNCYTIKAYGSSPTPTNPCQLTGAAGATFSQMQAFQVQLINLQLNANQGAPSSATATGQGVCTSSYSPYSDAFPTWLTDTWQYVATTQIQWMDNVQGWDPVSLTIPFYGSVIYSSRAQAVSTGGSTTYFQVSPCQCFKNDCCNPAAQGQCLYTCPPHGCNTCGSAAKPVTATKVPITYSLCTPIVIDLTGKGYHFTHPDVWFDVFGTGESLKIQWPTESSGNAWLVLPDEKGEVTQFSQFFGNLSPQPPSENPNGFRALAIWDEVSHGGNFNGYIDPGDGIWPLLRLWVDTNHDGIAQSNELHSLDEAGVKWFSLEYREGRSSMFRLAGIADLPRGASRIWDVWLSSQQ